VTQPQAKQPLDDSYEMRVGFDGEIRARDEGADSCEGSAEVHAAVQSSIEVLRIRHCAVPGCEWASVGHAHLVPTPEVLDIRLGIEGARVESRSGKP
jgi:hypothetical protein